PVVRSTHFRFSSFLLSITILPSARPVPNSTAPDCPQQSPDPRAFSELRRGASSLALCLPGPRFGTPLLFDSPLHHITIGGFRPARLSICSRRLVCVCFVLFSCHLFEARRFEFGTDQRSPRFSPRDSQDLSFLLPQATESLVLPHVLAPITADFRVPVLWHSTLSTAF
ncbi:hypothetical protein QBC46DRAFT_447315, partial [Diplogelasinospora grovesii]